MSARTIRFLSAAALLAALALAPSAQASVNRAQAARIAIAALHPARHANHLVVFGLASPVPAGARVFADAPQLPKRGALVLSGDELTFTLKPRPLVHAAWLFFEDTQYGATTDQAGVLVLVDTSSGRVVRREQLAAAPLIDGRALPFMRSESAYANQRGAVLTEAQRLAPKPKLHRTHAAADTAQAAAASVVPPNYFSDDCMVTIGDRFEVGTPAHKVAGFAGDLADLEAWGRAAGIRVYSAPHASGAAQLRNLIDRVTSQASPCRNIVLGVAGHGFPASAPGVVGTAQPSIQLSAQTKATKNGQQVVSWHLLNATDVARILRAHPQTQFELLLASCYSGRFIPALKAAQAADKLDNLLLLATQANATEVAYGYVANGQQGLNPPAGAQILPNPTAARQSPVPESDWMHQIVDGLDAWEHQQTVFYGHGPFPWVDTPIGFVGGLKRAVLDAPYHDFVAATLGWTHPQSSIGDLVKRYSYSIKAGVADGKESFHGYSTGSGTSTWDASWNRVWITIDRARRLVMSSTFVDKVEINMSASGDNNSDAYAGSASGSWTDHYPRTCSYAGLTPSGSVALRGFGADTYGDVHPYMMELSYQFAGKLSFSLDDAGTYNGAGTCMSGGDSSPAQPDRPFIGAANCATPASSRNRQVSVSAWDLGKQQIHGEAPFAGDLTGISCVIGPLDYGSDATATGTYKLDLARTPGT
jgi:hypothetical protein